VSRPPLAQSSPDRPDIARSKAIWFVVLVGIVSLFADMTYEGARSVTGPYLAVLGASGAVVGIVAGAGELVGYAIRLGSGIVADRTRRYWTITFVGYLINLGAVPLLALAGNWPLAAALMIAERTGKAMRTPARDAMLSHATYATGRGWGFGLHEAMDQAGAMIGPLVVTAALALEGSFRTSFALLLIPAVLSLSILAAAKTRFPNPRELEIGNVELGPRRLPRLYWIYLIVLALIAAGYADYPLIAYHFEKAGTVPKLWIPLLYTLAMGSQGLAALGFGRLFDRWGVVVLLPAIAIASSFAPWVFLGGFYACILGMIFWGVGMGAQESVLRAFIAENVSPERRAYAYGLMNAAFGVAWFAGSAVMGILYDLSIPAIVAFSVACELAALMLMAATALRSGGVKPRHKPAVP
jgi:MFS family permease